MVTVSNGINVFTIPEGAQKVYESMGFRAVIDNANISGKPVEGDSSPIDDLLEKPISSWNQAEVKEFAAAKGYDVSGAKSLKQAKAIIRKALEEEQKALAEV